MLVLGQLLYTQPLLKRQEFPWRLAYSYLGRFERNIAKVHVWTKSVVHLYLPYNTLWQMYICMVPYVSVWTIKKLLILTTCWVGSILAMEEFEDLRLWRNCNCILTKILCCGKNTAFPIHCQQDLLQASCGGCHSNWSPRSKSCCVFPTLTLTAMWDLCNTVNYTTQSHTLGYVNRMSSPWRTAATQHCRLVSQCQI